MNMIQTVTLGSALALSGGSLFSGVICTLSILQLYEHGFTVVPLDENSKYKILNLICCLEALVAFVTLNVIFTTTSWIFVDFFRFLTILLVYVALAIQNHSTLDRFRGELKPERTSLYYATTTFFYSIPAFALIPTYFAIAETTADDYALVPSSFNTYVTGISSIFIVTLSHLAASVMDYKIFRNYLSRKDSGRGCIVDIDGPKKASLVSIFLLIGAIEVLDFLAKALNIGQYSIIFDLSVTVCSICVRNRLIQTFGLFIQKATHIDKKHRSGPSSEPMVEASLKSSHFNIEDNQIVKDPKQSLVTRPMIKGVPTHTYRSIATRPMQDNDSIPEFNIPL